MENGFSPDSVRSRLIFSGLKELKTHGIGDFSLRRVAQDAGVSCAAPYRHFKDKDELIVAVINFVVEGWGDLCSEIAPIYADAPGSLIVELSVCALRFWVANGNFKTVISASSTFADSNGPLKEFDKPIVDAIDRYAKGKDSCDKERLRFKILSMLYGAIILVDGGYESIEKAADNLRNVLLREL